MEWKNARPPLPGANYTNTIAATNNGTMEQWNKKKGDISIAFFHQKMI